MTWGKERNEWRQRGTQGSSNVSVIKKKKMKYMDGKSHGLIKIGDEYMDR